MIRSTLLGVLLLAAPVGAQIQPAESLARQLDETRRELVQQQAETIRLRALLETTAYQHRLDLARREWFDGNVARAQVLLDECPDSQRGFEWRFLDQLIRGGRVTGLGATDAGLGLAFRPGDNEVMLLSTTGTVYTWEVGPGQEARFAVPSRAIPGPVSRPRRAARSLDGNLAALADDGADVSIIDLRTREVRKITAPAFPVADLAFSRDGRRFALLARNTVSVRDLATNEELFSATLTASGAVCLDLAPEGDYLAVGHLDGTVRVWDLTVGRAILTVRNPGSPTRLRFHPEGDRLGVLVGDRLRVWRLSSGTPESVEPAGAPSGITSFAWSPDGTRLAAGVGVVVHVWDAQGRTLLEKHRGHTDTVRHVAFSTDARRLASHSEDGVLKVWDVPGHPAGVLFPGHLAAITAVVWSPDGQQFATASTDRTVKVWEVGTRRVVGLLGSHPGGVTSLAWSPDGKQLATGCEDGVLRTWNPRTGQPLEESLAGFQARLTGVAFSPDGKYLAGISREGFLQVLSRADRKANGVRLPAAGIFGLAFRPDGSSLAVSCSDLTDVAIRLFNPATLRELEVLKGPRARAALAWSPDGATLAFASSTGTRLFRRLDKTTELVLRGVDGAFDQASSLAFSSDGRRLATTGTGRPVRLWDVATGLELVATPEGISGGALAFSPDGARLVVGDNNGMIRVFEAPARTYPHTFLDSSYHLAFSPDGRFLVTGLRQPEHLLQLWDRKTGRKGAVVDTLGGGLLSHLVYFSPDGSTLRTLQEQREAGKSKFLVRFWDVTRGNETGRNIIEPPSAPVHWHWIGTHLAVATKKPEANSMEIRIWDALSGKLLTTIPEVGERVSSILLNPDGTRVLYTSLEEGKVETRTTIRDAASGRPAIGRLEDRLGDKEVSVSRLVYGPGSEMIAGYATVGTSTRLVTWNAVSGEVVKLVPIERIGGPLVFSPDGAHLLTLDGAIVTVYPTGKGTVSAHIVAPHEPFHGDQLLFTPDGKQLAVKGGLSHSSRVYLWDFPFQVQGDVTAARNLDALAAHISHRHEASAALRDRHWYAAVFHLDRLLLQQPDQIDLYKQRGRALVGMEEYARAVPDMVRAIQADIHGVGDGLLKENWAALLPEIDKALEKDAENWSLLALLGTSHAGKGDWKSAVGAFARALRVGGNRLVVLEGYAYAALGADDSALYKKLAGQLLDAVPQVKDATTANRLAWTALISPGVNPERPLLLAKRAVEAASFAPGETRHAYLNTLALAYHRAGKPDEAERMVQAAIDAREGRPSRLDHLLLAILRGRGEKKEAARLYLAQALRGLEDDPVLLGVWEARLELARIRAEAEAVLGK